MKKFLFVGTVIAIVALTPSARKFIVTAANDFAQMYREREHAIRVAVLENQ